MILKEIPGTIPIVELMDTLAKIISENNGRFENIIIYPSTDNQDEDGQVLKIIIEGISLG